LLKILSGQKNFIGIFSSNNLHAISIKSYPCFIIVNVVHEQIKIGHWIAIRLGTSSVEIFDSLGYKIKNWGYYPPGLLKFLSNYAFSHKFIVSQVLQNSRSLFCGLYCAYFILYRENHTFSSCVKPFRNLSTNDAVLIHLLKNLD
jgi:hypothetical protein